MKIRRRLAVFGAAVTTAALIVFAVLLNLIVEGGVGEDQDKLLGGIAASAVASIEAADTDRFDTRIPPVVADPAISDQPFVVAVDGDGTLLYATADVSVLPAALVVEAVATGSSETTAGGARYQALRFEHPEIGPGVVAAGQSTRVTEQQLAGFRVFLIVFALITVIAAAAVSWLVSGRALRPLMTLAATADEIAGTGDLSSRLPPVEVNDEVGTLTRSFNGMLDRLEGTREQLERALESQRRFVADASHELRSPLTTIRSNAGFLEDRPDADRRDRAEAIADIHAEADRMSRLVDDLLILARSDAGGAAPTEPVALGPLIESIRRRARHLDGRLTVDVAGPAVVEGDADAFSQLVWILVDNADTHGEGAITVRVRPEGGWARLTVTDRGPGIPKGDEERIFERFHQADPVRGAHGSGLGLAIGRSIVDRHGGTIDAASGDNGAVFTVMLPLA